MSGLEELDETVFDAQEGAILPDKLDKVGAPTAEPVPSPTVAPTSAPTPAPTAEPTAAPTPAPTAAPTPAPTAAPTPAPKPPRKPIGAYLLPHLAVALAAGVLVLIFAVGVAFGVLLSGGRAPFGGFVIGSPVQFLLTPLTAPAGVILFLLGAIVSWAKGFEKESSALNILGWALLVLFFLGIS